MASTHNRQAQYFNQKAAMKSCPRCGTGKIYSGHLSQYNAKANDGTQVCTSCKVDDIYKSLGVEG